MPTPKQQVIDALNELEILEAERRDLMAKQERAVAKYRAEFERAVAPVNEKYQLKLAPVNQRIYALQKEVEAALLNNTNSEGVPKLQSVSTESMMAEVVQSAARREVDAETFFNFVPALHRRGATFWNCFSVQIAKAEKFLGEKINEIARIKPSFKVVIKQK